MSGHGQPPGYKIVGVTQASRIKGAKANAANADAFARSLRPLLKELNDLSAYAVAAELNRRGVSSARGGEWTARSVINIRQRLAR